MVTDREIEILKILKLEFTTSEIVRFAKVPYQYVVNMHNILPERINKGADKEVYRELFTELHDLRKEFKGMRKDAYLRNIRRESANKAKTILKSAKYLRERDEMIKEFVNIHKSSLICCKWY